MKIVCHLLMPEMLTKRIGNRKYNEKCMGFKQLNNIEIRWPTIMKFLEWKLALFIREE